MCEAADIHPVVTMNNKETPEDMADFVECVRRHEDTCPSHLRSVKSLRFRSIHRYCYGPETSTWGAVRKADGHPQPYNKVRQGRLHSCVAVCCR